MKRKIAVLGGDKRSVFLAQLLKEEGYQVTTFGFSQYKEKKEEDSETLYDAIKEADLIVCPIPCSPDGVHLNVRFHDQNIKMEDIFKRMDKKQVFVAGYIKPEIAKMAQTYDIVCMDILKEDLAILNAIPTAEGAIKVAIDNTNFTLHGSNVMVIGYGRIGAILSKMLAGMGAIVHTVVRKQKDMALPRSFGYKAILTENINHHLQNMNVVFNTAPNKVIDDSNVPHIPPHCLLIDLSSAPYGIDFAACKQKGLQLIYANSLPGIIAPLTVASYIKEAVDHVIKDLEG